MELDELRVQEAERLADYQQVFQSEKGQRVLADLEQRFLWRLASREHAAGGNALGLAYIAGQRELLINIRSWVNCDAQAKAEQLFPLIDKENEPNAGQSESNLREWSTGDPFT